MSLSRSHRRVCSTLLDNLVCTARVSLRTRRLCWSTEKCTCRVYCRRSRHDGAATRSRKGVLVFTVHSATHLALSHHSVPCSQQQQRAGALTLSSSCLDGSVTPVGPGPKPTVHRCSQSGRRLWVAQSTTTSPMAQPLCSKKQCINVNTPPLCMFSPRNPPNVVFQKETVAMRLLQCGHT